MNFFGLRRDLNDLFNAPLFGYDDPFDQFDELRRQTLNLFDAHAPALPDGQEEGAASSNETAVAPRKPARWIPRCDVVENKDNFIIHAELPGMDKSQIKIEFDDDTNVLTLSGERKNQHEEKKEEKDGSKYHLIERSSGTFMRSFRLPDACRNRVDEIKALSKDGVLEITCPKEEPKPVEKKTKQITIN